ncbi:hypothetical protein V2I01_35175 [Micromonospora sp. BRA006-A]|nr:hypothetical protein [Micromonospora sp. BRA006-A]
MRWIHRDSLITCGHDGRVRNRPSQDWVTVQAVPVLVRPTRRTRHHRLPQLRPDDQPCLHTLTVTVGYSTWVRVDRQPVVLSHLDGLTDGTPPGTVHHQVRDVRQRFLGADA